MSWSKEDRGDGKAERRTCLKLGWSKQRRWPEHPGRSALRSRKSWTSAGSAVEQTLQVLAQRANQLEALIIGSMLGVLATTTLAAYAAIANLSKKDGQRGSPALPRHLLVLGIALLFFFLASYYYTVVSYYFTTLRAIILLRVPAMNCALYELSRALRVLPFSGSTGRFLYLLSPCLFPLAFYSLSLIGVWTVAMQHERPGPRFDVLAFGLALQVVAFAAYAWVPFAESWKVIRSLP